MKKNIKLQIEEMLRTISEVEAVLKRRVISKKD